MKHKSFLTVFVLFVVSLFVIFCSHNPNSQKNRPQPKGAPVVAKLTENKQNQEIPAKVYEVLKFVKLHHRAPEGYVGGRRFGNFEKKLPQTDGVGRKISYQEWDVNPHLPNKNRGAERLITGSDARAYYTKDHYQSFIEIK